MFIKIRNNRRLTAFEEVFGPNFNELRRTSSNGSSEPNSTSSITIFSPERERDRNEGIGDSDIYPYSSRYNNSSRRQSLETSSRRQSLGGGTSTNSATNHNAIDLPRASSFLDNSLMRGHTYLNCAICLEKINPGAQEDRLDKKLRIVPGCGHVFHSECVDGWILKRRKCPCCQGKVSF